MQSISKLTKEEVLHVAKLAKLSITDDEAESFRGDLSAVLTFVEKLQEVSVEGVKPTSQAGDLKSIMRDDERDGVNEEKEKMRAEGMIAQLPSKQDNLLKVPTVFENKKV
ncbi:MAG: Asp-tRNA(Asn)/Glu-tRNA(Gln) amidotransferase subunit GatC [Candidatus Spechtbacteria bacterium]|nr:Asp-tRNA(Asn)/Glu-tRNA(Gln) amidotransferase subunit GatC [Candidatus Spechtbacteria bacterium]